jgi:transketolase
MERVNGDNLYRYHSGALSAAEYKTASTQLLEAVQSELGRHGIKPVKTVREELPPKSSSDKKTSLVAAYSDAIVEFGKRKKDFIALDADLTVDLGLLPFKRTFPDRHIQAGIAEQDMVSFAGGLATQGVIPIVHSFACFLTPRANEQIYNNASERTKIIYVGGLAGVLPGMPGHSHQSVRDIAIMNAIPGLAIVEPSDADETRRALEYALTATQSTYIRLTSVPWHIPYTIPKTSLQRPGVGTQVRAGKDIAVIAYGPAMVSEAYEAAALAERDGLRVAVYAFPWLNQTNDKWVAREFGKYKKIVVIDNHYIQGGLGERIQASLQRSSVETACAILGLTDIPPFGQNDEVLKACGFDRQSLVKTLRKMHRAR